MYETRTISSSLPQHKKASCSVKNSSQFHPNLSKFIRISNLGLLLISYPVCAFYIFSLNADITIYAALSIKWTLQGKTKIIFWLQEGAIAPLRVKVIFISLVSIKLPLTNWNSSCTDLPLTHWWHCKTWKSHIFCHVIYPFSDFVFRFEVILLNEFFEM